MMSKWAKTYALVGILSMGFALPNGAFGGSEIDGRIKSLEQELSQLKEQQIELKKEATAAAAAMPSFEYRPGNGISIEAADKAWGIRFTNEMHFRYNFESGRDQQGRSRGEMMGRRFRPGILYCLNNCLWEVEASLDLDGWGTGNGKNNAGTAPNSILQRGAVIFHAENLNPWLPFVQFGMEVQNAHGGSLARQGSGATGAQAEYDLATRNDGFNTGRAGSGIVLNWDDRSLSRIGIPGRLRRFQFGMSQIAEGDDGTQSNTDRKDFNAYLSVQPFSQVKNKWINGLTFEYGSWFCNVDGRKGSGTTDGCSRYRVQDHGDGGRQTLFDTGSGSIGKGLHISHGPGIVWNVGPYTLRGMGNFQRSEDLGGSTGKKRTNSFLIGHDLFLWSPKGFLTGSATTTGSILVGTHFERVDLSCGDRIRGCTSSPEQASSGITSINGGQYHRERVLLREWDVWYFIAPRMSMGVSWLWYDASNLRSTSNQAANNLGLCDRVATTSTTNCRVGGGGSWVDVMLNWRYTF
jgi:hypothetical protein